MRNFWLVVLTVLIFEGCSTRYAQPKTQPISLQPYTPPSSSNDVPYKPAKTNKIIDILYQEYKKWYATPYKYGGNDCNGIDCSALVQNVYRDGFGIAVPRTTQQQATIGTFVAKKELRAGDLVLFKTGWSSRHSGIYIESGNFLHASTKHGVTISNIHNPYWRSVYWQARRILFY